MLILARGDRVRHMTIRPWMAALAGCTIGLFSLGYLGATGYLILRDDLIGATMARQTRMQNDYEDRIAALRARWTASPPGNCSISRSLKRKWKSCWNSRRR